MWRFVVRKSPQRENPENDIEVTADDIVNTQDSVSEAQNNVASPIEPTSSATTEDLNKKAKVKQTRKFNPSWQHAFPWVKLVNKKMFCDVCINSQQADTTSTFVKGSDNFHVKSLRKHASSKAHVKCVANAKARSAPLGTNPAEKALQVLHEKEFKKMRVLFRISHSLPKKGRPFSDYEWSLDLHERTHNVNLGETY